MTVRKRVHVIDPKKLRVDRSANDNLKKARKQARVRLIEPDEPVPASLARERLGLPHPAQFSKAGVLDLVIDRFLADDIAFESYQRKTVRSGVVGRFQHALDLASNPEAFAEWKKKPRIVGLARPPKSEEDICRALFRASYLNPKDASKRFKRIEHLWKKREPASKVLAFLDARGLQDPPAAKGKRLKPGDTLFESPQNTKMGMEDSPEEKSAQAVNTQPKPKGVHVNNLASDYVAGKQVGDTVALAGVVLSKQGNSVVLQLEGCG